jgi:branched-subunit amino acid transport protein
MNSLIIILLAVITFSTRYLLLHPKFPIKLNAKTSQFLSFSAPAVLTAIWVPIILIHNDQLALNVANPYIPAAIIAIAVAAKTHSIYLTLLISGAFFIGLKMFLG